ncbi:hypothetical protein F5B22DRAFT_650963 [Xylaria bambusicola]|uniref:uncharacterized protein n=1 Tax=Xylaria bambusicola TaxID=326684 RepID=UPI002007E6C4|nr:uncharacterized protein F5B22DRAFT_650963 [Xylaria bambusicola]KAI0506256.1 hypothetical protein F5B22DRAFT_650963 [Xylaria bambusicola]
MKDDPIAIVGSSCRLPGGATSPSKLWGLLESPRDVLQEIPATRFNTKAFHHTNSQHHGSMNVRHAYLLDEDPRGFDRDFFSINPKEAEAMDPQQRLLLETVYEGIESAGYSMHQLKGSSTAVFVGCMSFDYQFTAIRGIESLPQYHATGTAASILANRLSYFYDWRGPSVAIDTACSSSLVALHQAVSALRNGEATMAVAAGSNLIIGPEPFVSESKLNMLSPNGRSFMWDASADGYTRGEGFAAVFLKTLSQAIADGDHIECIVRETGVNSDGKTPGITMPSSESQARLIRDTYLRCGLDPALESDRPQYFEAHGTGTPAGDPIEARAIQSVFFPDGNDGQLMVGSIKTIIGHTEGTAGLAGVLKASLAVQHGEIPANLHFNKLNPKIKPYYTNLRIPTEKSAWPIVPEGSPRRVSVNSFGFGGTNAHAIIESWDGHEHTPKTRTNDIKTNGHTNGHTTNGHVTNGFATNGHATNGHTTNGHATNGSATNGHAINGHAKPNGHTPNGKPQEIKASDDGKINGHTTTKDTAESQVQSAGPFVLSANSSTALAANAAALSAHLRANPSANLAQLAYTLFRRTDFPFRAAFSATSAEQLADKLEAATESLKGSTRTATIPEVLPPRILGVFTGQGAQWATMGKDLYGASAPFRDAIDKMQESLDSLPLGDRPDWTLVDQLYAPLKTSRVGEAAVSQPLCTALQVGLVDALRAAGIHFAAVVGHSSGEIGAAYAAGYLDAKDAIRVAYYRGVHSHLAHGPGGKRGKMMAVGMSLGQATAFCSDFSGAITVAASNSQTSCTLAGDAEAIDEAEARLRENGTFARVLQVDTAYHSHHMKPCGNPYLESMKQCGVKVNKGRKQCTWYSSVWGANGRIRSFDQVADSVLLEGQYWVDNMTQAVLFSQAVSRALNEDQYFDLALEVGPHPALKGPSSETIKSLSGLTLPYSGVLKRGQSAVESFADALGFLWKLFPSSSPLITFDGVRRAFANGTEKQKLTILKGLPAYSWDHPGLIWKESRSARIFRTQDQARHELLGHCVTHGERGKREIHWKQLIRLSELPWIAGHRIQGEVLFPASGYLSMAYEAATRLADDQQPMRLIELHDINIERAMRLEEDSSGLEVVFTVHVTSQSDECITAEVACYSGPVDSVQPLDTPQAKLTSHFTGGVRVWLGEPSKDVLPRRTKPLLPMDALDMEQLYSSLAEEGFNYAELFQAKSMLRRLHRAVVTVSSPPEGSSIRSCMHPAPVDTAFQGLLAAFSFPGDGRVNCIYLPTRVECVRISMAPSEPQESLDLNADATVTATGKTTLTGDVDLFDAADGQINVQVRGVHLTAVGQRRDPWLYADTTWVRDADFGIEPGKETKLSEQEKVLYEQLTRTAHFYLRQLRKKILKQELMLMGKYRRHMMTWVLEHLLPQIDAGEHPEVKPEWKNDTLAMVQEWRDSQPADNNDMNILHAMGKNLVSIVRGTTPPLKVLTQDGMLDRLYVEGLGAKDGNEDLAVMVKQIAHRYPRMNVLEVGAGTGGTTRAVLDALGTQYASYTYTDISTGFFDNARTVFSNHINKLNFKTLNIENDPVDQGFENGAYDMVVSSNCLHATKSLDETLRHCRQLLRPGGRLVLLEITKDFLPTQLVMSTLPGWFLGIDDGRVWAPTVGLDRWDTLLKANGFSGVDISSTPSFCSVIVAQAVDESIQLLREPLNAGSAALPPINDIIIIGGGASAELASKTKAVLEAAVSASTKITALSGLEGINVPKRATVLCLNDLDSPAFRDMNEKRFKGLQDLMETAESVLWVASGAKSGKDPEANITLGLSSTLRAERMDFRLQFLDVDDPSSLVPTTLAEMLLRLALVDPSETDHMLWTQEPELALKNGAFYIPRVLPLDDINRRSAARIRNVTQTTSLQAEDTAVVLDDSQNGFELQAIPFGSTKGDEFCLRVTASSLSAIVYDGQETQFVCIGHELSSGDKVLALSSVNGSLVKVPRDHILCRWQDDKLTAVDDIAWLHQFLAQALARHLLSNLKAPAWVHGAPDSISKVIDTVASEQGITVFQTTSRMSDTSGVNFIHPYASEEDIQEICPSGLQSFVNLAQAQHQTIPRLIQAAAPAATIANKSTNELIIKLSLSDLGNLAVKLQSSLLQVLSNNVEVTGIDQASTLKSGKSDPTEVINWTTTDSVSALVQPLESRGLFSPDKTYLLCGMTGDLGISVCLWMVENGARNVVLTSRNPNVPQGVLNYLSRKGANVRPMAADIVNMDSLRAAHAEIKSTMPPIGGVMNAAMVLRDRLFHHLPWEDFYATLAPKVVGSKNLDAVFGDEPLDFFICFSSTTSIVGSIGQSAYAAANHYMASLVQGRRQRGLAGSLIHIAILTGFGYIFRRDSDHAETIYKAILPRFNRESETDLHEMLAEAVVCGRPGSGQTGELITGIRPVFQGEWRDDPRLSCYSGQQQQQDDAGAQQSGGAASIKSQLADAEDAAECLTILEQGFKIALGNMLEIDPQVLDSKLPVASLGIDSLVAIRIREWFLKEMGVDVPVLKVMSDTYSMSRMCDDVLVDWRKNNKA